MSELVLHSFHKTQGGNFRALDGIEVVNDYGNFLEEHRFLNERAGILDLSFRSRLCIVGQDRIRFLHGQVTNDVKSLAVWTGCYSALTSAKGKMQTDLNIYRLEEELLLDFEPGLQQNISERLEKYIVADDVQVLDVASLYGLLSIQGPKARTVVCATGLFDSCPEKLFSVVKQSDRQSGELYLMNHPRFDGGGFDLFIPSAAQVSILRRFIETAGPDGRLCGWQALETTRIESGIPRFGTDMDEKNFPQESSIESQAVSYTKGCYIGQETLNRIHTIGHVNNQLTGLRLSSDLKNLPAKGDKLFEGAKEIGFVTSSIDSPTHQTKIALGYVRREVNQIGRNLILHSGDGTSSAQIAGLQFEKP